MLQQPVNRTELEKLGEFGLIDHLTSGFQIQNKSSKQGIGDDAAVLNYGDSSINLKEKGKKSLLAPIQIPV